MEAKSIIGWAIGGVTLLILSIFALIVYLKRKTIFRCKDLAKTDVSAPSPKGDLLWRKDGPIKELYCSVK